MLLNLKTLDWDKPTLDTLGLPDEILPKIVNNVEIIRTVTIQYALVGSIAIAGAAVQWLRDSLCIISFASEIEELATKVDSSGGVYFVSLFNGLFAPWWRNDALGGGEVKNEKRELSFRVDVGATINNLFMQMYVYVFSYSLIQYLFCCCYT
ncbi:hypothetical protein PVL29_011999 [Vitis rotundifolia]|uniref:Uncharacterized protein n=1 Tax=Vitis rotundifolia TaxID=103349 RepID=A0AA38ZQU2_VITRO|nr:hypothetical protein PVL29_011999 [Vitis rotundifolia]